MVQRETGNPLLDFILRILSATIFGAIIIVFLPLIQSFVSNPVTSNAILDFFIKSLVIGIVVSVSPVIIVFALVFTVLFLLRGK